nr:agamous-like MADS-box protein AGL61 [Ipomoea batatas]
MSTLCGTEIAMVVFSPSGKPFSFSNPDMNTVLTKYFGENPRTEANVAEHIIRAHQDAKMRAMTSQINVLEALIDEEMLVDQALREAEKGRPSISDLQLPELQSMKHHMETLLDQVTEKLNMISIMGAQSQAMETRFGANDGVGPSGGTILLDWLKDKFDSLTKYELAHFITICWSIWTARNQKIWNGVDSSPKFVVQHSLSYLKEWKYVRTPPTTVVCSQRNQVKWVKPSVGSLKLNIDVSVHCDASHVGMGWILRDQEGCLVAAQAETRRNPLHPREVEALAVLDALSWLKDYHWDNVLVETDAEVVVRSLRKPSS